MPIHPIDRNGVWLDEASADIAQLEALCKQQTDPASVPLASGVVSAQSAPGENVNHIIPGGNDNVEPVSGQAIMHGHSVEVRKVS